MQNFFLEQLLKAYRIKFQKFAALVHNDALINKSNRKAMNRNWSNQKANPALKTKAGKE